MKKWILRCMLAVSLLLVICVTVGAIGEEKLPGDAGYGYSYRFVTRDTIEITAYTGYEHNVTVPTATLSSVSRILAGMRPLDKTQ